MQYKLPLLLRFKLTGNDLLIKWYVFLLQLYKKRQNIVSHFNVFIIVVYKYISTIFF